MKDYKELIAKLRATKSQSKRKMLDEAADAIEHLQRQIAHKEDVIKQQGQTIMDLRKEREAAVECIETVAAQFDRGACHDDYAEAAIDKWRSLEASHG